MIVVQVLAAGGFLALGCWMIWRFSKEHCRKSMRDLEAAVNWGCAFWLMMFATLLIPMLILSF